MLSLCLYICVYSEQTFFPESPLFKMTSFSTIIYLKMSLMTQNCRHDNTLNICMLFCIFKVSSKLQLMSFAITMQEKMVVCAFQIFQGNKCEGQLLTPWTTWKNTTKRKRSAGS